MNSIFYMKKDPSIFLQHIQESIEYIEEHTKKFTKSQFVKNVKTQDAVIRRIEIIGEAVKNLPQNYKKQHTNITWREIAGMRDRLIHGYFGINLATVWKTVKHDIPKLKKQIVKLLVEKNS